MNNMKNKLFVVAGLVGILSSTSVIANDISSMEYSRFLTEEMIPKVEESIKQFDLVVSVEGCGKLKHPFSAEYVFNLRKDVQRLYPKYLVTHFVDHNGKGPYLCIEKEL